jgi:hypothetical protein
MGAVQPHLRCFELPAGVVADQSSGHSDSAFGVRFAWSGLLRFPDSVSRNTGLLLSDDPIGKIVRRLSS